LGENSLYFNLGDVHLHEEWQRRVRMSQNTCVRKMFLERMEGFGLLSLELLIRREVRGATMVPKPLMKCLT
jgi:hypothetical protein